MLEPLNPATPQPLNASPRRRRLRLTSEGWGAVAATGWVLAAAVMSHASLVLLVFCLLSIALLIGLVQTLRNVRKIEVSRHLPEHAVARRPFRVEISVRNRRWTGAAQAIAVTSNVRPGSLDERPCVFLPTVPSRSEASQHIEVTLPSRGLYRFGALELTSRYPFGFLERSVPLGDSQELLVYPQVGRLSRRFFEIERDQHLYQHGRRPGRSTLEADYHGLRDLRAGDSARWIHWPTSARRGRLMVKEFEAPRNRDVAILLEPWLPPRPDTRDQSLLELAISFAATLCVDLCQRQNLHIVLGIAANPPIIRHGQSSQRLLHELLGQLAVLQGTNEPRWDALIEDMPVTWMNSMRITAISPRPLDLASWPTASPGATQGKWQRMTRRLMMVDAGSGELRDYFQLL